MRSDFTLALKSKYDLFDKFSSLGISVPDRTRPKDQDALELWCLRRYLLSLAETDLLAYPTSVQGGESPDFMLLLPDESSIGLEVTDATTAEYQIQSTKAARAGRVVVELPSCLAGWGAGAEVNEWCALMRHAIAEKTALLPGYRPASRYELLLHDNNEIPVAGDKELESAILRLRFAIGAPSVSQRVRRQFVSVSIVRCAVLALDVFRSYRLITYRPEGELSLTQSP